MAKNTINYGFVKPDDEDFYDIQLENANWDKADQELKKLSSEKVDKVSGKQLSTNDYTNAEKTKLAGVATNANNYTHPSTHPATVTVQDATHRFVTDTEKTAWNGKVTASGGDISNTKISSFDASTADLPVPVAGDTTKVFSGKVKKFFEDIKAWKPNVLMKSMVVNNFTTTVAGMVADARALKTLYDQYAQLNSDLSVRNISGTDVFDLSRNGNYVGNNMINSPDGSDGWFYLNYSILSQDTGAVLAVSLNNVNSKYKFYTNTVGSKKFGSWTDFAKGSDLGITYKLNVKSIISVTAGTTVTDEKNIPAGTYICNMCFYNSPTAKTQINVSDTPAIQGNGSFVFTHGGGNIRGYCATAGSTQYIATDNDFIELVKIK